MSNTDFNPDAYLSGQQPSTPAPPVAAPPPPAAAPSAPAAPPTDQGFDPDQYLTAHPTNQDTTTQPAGPGSGNMLTDVWPEVKQAASGAWQTIKQGLGPANEAQLEEEEKNTPWWDIGPVARSTLRTGKALGAIAAAPFDIAVGAPARSLIGHPLATADRAMGNLIAPSELAKETPEQTYERWRGNVDTALSAAKPAGEMGMVPALATPPGKYEVPSGTPIPSWQFPAKPVPTPPQGTPPANPNLSYAEIKAGGPKAQARFGAWQNEQENNVAGAMGSTTSVVDSPETAADAITNELINQKRGSDQNVRQTGDQLTRDILDYRTRLSPTNSVLASDPMEAANVVSGAIANEAERYQAATDAAYKAMRELPGNFHPATFNNIGDVIQRKVTAGPDPTIINPQTTPIANAALSDLDDVLSGLKQQRDPDTGKIVPRLPITPEVVENARKRLNSFYGQALQSARASNNYSDARATGRIVNAFDDYVTNRLKAGTFTGGDPSGVVDAMQNARQQYSNYRKTFTPQGPGDAVGQAIQKVLGRYEGQAATPEQVQSLLYKGQSAPAVGQRLIKMFGQNSPEVGAVKQGLISYIMQRPPGAPAWDASKVADRIDAFTRGPGSTLTRTYLSPAEIRELQGLGARARNFHNLSNPDLDPIDEIINRVTGVAGGAQASNQDVIRNLFHQSLKGGRYAEQLQTRLFQRLSPEGQSAFRNGLTRYAASPIEGKEAWAPGKVADRLSELLNSTRNTKTFSTDQRNMINGYAKVMRQLDESDKIPLAQRYLRRFGGLIGFAVSDALLHHVGVPWGVSEVTAVAGDVAAIRLAQNMAARRVAKQLPLLTEQMAKYQNALRLYQKSQNPVTTRLIGTTFSNFARSAEGIGIPKNALPPPPNEERREPNRADGGTVTKKDQDRVPPGPLVPGLYNLPIPGSQPVLTSDQFVNRADGGSLDDDSTPDDPSKPPLGWISVHSNAPTPVAGGTSDIASATPPATPSTSQNAPNIPPQSSGQPNLEPPPSPSGGSASPSPSTPQPSPDDIANWEAGSENKPPPSDGSADNSRSMLDKLLGIGGPRYELWPERMVRSALTAPGEVLATGQVPVRDEYGRVVGAEPEMSMGPTSTDMDFNEYGIPFTGIHWATKAAPTPIGFPSDAAIQRSQDIAGMAGGTSFGAGAEEGALGVAGGKLGIPEDWTASQAKPGNQDLAFFKNPNAKGSGPLYYHDTDTANIPGILQQGLLPSYNMIRGGYVWANTAKNFKASPDNFYQPGDAVVVFRGKPYDRDGRGVQFDEIPPENIVGVYTHPKLLSDSGEAGAPLAALENSSPFYSAVERAVTNAPQSKMQASQWIGWLRNQPGVKPEELSWLGLGDKSQLPTELQGPITKDQLLGHLKENNPVNLQMVEKGGQPWIDDETIYEQMRDDFERDYPRATPQAFTDYLDTPRGEQEFAQRRGQTPSMSSTPKYSEYQLPGGENYRETLLTLPQRTKTMQGPGEGETFQMPEGPSFQSSHWDEPNVLLHMRMNDRQIPGVGKSLHLEELQSDWAQTGRKRGFQPPQPIGPVDPAQAHNAVLEYRAGLQDKYGDNWFDKVTPTERHEYNRRIGVDNYAQGYRGEPAQAPDMPFKQTWPDLGLKTAINKAAREGYDSISWTPGEQQAARYDLSKQVKQIDVSPRNEEGTKLAQIRMKDGHTLELGVNKNGVVDHVPYGGGLQNTDRYIGKSLADIVGKEVADKIMSANRQTLSGDDLKVGGEGMKGFYDKMLVNKANAIGKKFGSQVQWKDMPVTAGDLKPGTRAFLDAEKEFVQKFDLKPVGTNRWQIIDKSTGKKIGPTHRTGDEATSWLLKNEYYKIPQIKVPVLPLTPALKKAALSGMPLFSDSGKVGAPLSALEHSYTANDLFRKIDALDAMANDRATTAGEKSNARELKTKLEQKLKSEFPNATRPSGGAHPDRTWRTWQDVVNDPFTKWATGMADYLGKEKLWQTDKNAAMAELQRLKQRRAATIRSHTPGDVWHAGEVEEAKRRVISFMRRYLPEMWEAEEAKLEAARSRAYERADQKRAEKQKQINSNNKGKISYSASKALGNQFYQKLKDKVKGVYNADRWQYNNSGGASFISWLAKAHAPVLREIVKDLNPKELTDLISIVKNGAEEGQNRLFTAKQKEDFIQKLQSKQPQYGHPDSYYYERAKQPSRGRFADGGVVELNRAAGGRVDAKAIDQNPSEAQIKAGNYAKDHVTIQGLPITIENARGHKRRGIDASGKFWECTLPCAYGYLKKTEGADGDHVDVYLGPHPKSNKVFVIDQIDHKNKSFDEHKVMVGFATKNQATAYYKKAFSDGKGYLRIGHIHEMTMQEFKEWLKLGDTTKPIKKITREAFQYHLTKGNERCSTCRYTSGTDNGCGLFRMINQRIQEDFDLNPDIADNGWCSGFTPRGE